MASDTRGFCPECSRFMQLKVDGALRHHGGPLGTGYVMGGRSRSYRCVGAGTVPPSRLTGRSIFTGDEFTGTFSRTWESARTGSWTWVAALLDDLGDEHLVYADSVRVAAGGA